MRKFLLLAGLLLTYIGHAQNDSSYVSEDRCTARIDNISVEVTQKTKKSYSSYTLSSDYAINSESGGSKVILPPSNSEYMPYAYQNGDTIWDDQDPSVFNKIDNLSYERSHYYVKYQFKTDVLFKEKSDKIKADLTDQGWLVIETYKVVTTNEVYYLSNYEQLNKNLPDYHQEGKVRIEQTLGLTNGNCKMEFPVIYEIGKQ